MVSITDEGFASLAALCIRHKIAMADLVTLVAEGISLERHHPEYASMFMRAIVEPSVGDREIESSSQEMASEFVQLVPLEGLLDAASY